MLSINPFIHHYITASDIDSQAACLVLEDFYQAKGRNAEVVYPDEGITRFVPPLSSQSEKKGSASDDNASTKAAFPVKSPVMSFDVSFCFMVSLLSRRSS